MLSSPEEHSQGSFIAGRAHSQLPWSKVAGPRLTAPLLGPPDSAPSSRYRLVAGASCGPRARAVRGGANAGQAPAHMDARARPRSGSAAPGAAARTCRRRAPAGRPACSGVVRAPGKGARAHLTRQSKRNLRPLARARPSVRLCQKRSPDRSGSAADASEPAGSGGEQTRHPPARARAWHWFMKRSLGHELLVQPAGQVAVGWQSGGKPVA
jgi:hypothetical protein